MGGLKPIGSEKLDGMDKIRRIMEIARYKENIPKTITEVKSSEYKLSLSDGNTYEIIKERQGYIIKQTISESVSDYIAPMKNRRYYSSYSQALKKMNLMAREFNQLYGNESGTSLFEQEDEKKKDTKYVISTSKKTEGQPVTTTTTTIAVPPVAVPPVAVPPVAVPPVAAPPVAAPTTPQPMEEQGDPTLNPLLAPQPGSSPAPDPAAVPDPAATAPDPAAVPEEVPVPEEGMEPEEVPATEEEVTFKIIQKLTGKLAQKIRTYNGQEEMSSNDTKYVINSILSALDLTTLEEEDVEDIISRLEGEEEEIDGEEEGLEGEEMDTEGEGMEGEVTEPQPEAEMGEEYNNFGGAFNDYLGAAYTSKMSDNLMNEFDDEEYNEYENEYPRHGSREKFRKYDDEETFEDLFTESKVDKIISNYFSVDKNEKLIKEQKQKQTLKKLNEKEVYKLSESIKQERSSLNFMEQNPKAILVGSTVNKNLVFKQGIKEFRITPNGQVI